jgi:hypothetical protein
MSDMSIGVNNSFRLWIMRWRAKTTIADNEVNILTVKRMEAYNSGIKLFVNPNMCAGHANRKFYQWSL